MKKHQAPFLIIICFALLFALIAPSPAQADTNNDNGVRLGVGLGYSAIMEQDRYGYRTTLHLSTLYLSFQYAVNSFYRMGIEERLSTFVPFVISTITLWTHEFVILNKGSFELTPHFGVGYQAYGEWDRGGHGPAINVGLGFGWAVTSLISLQLNFDYSLLSTQMHSEHRMLHQLHMTFNIVFRL